MINKTQILASMEAYFEASLSDKDAFIAINADYTKQEAYKTRLNELMIRIKTNSYKRCSFVTNGKLLANINFQETPLITAIEDLIPNALLPFESIALEFDVEYLKIPLSQQVGFHVAQIVILADNVKNKEFGSLIRVSGMYQIHNFTIKQNHYTVASKDIYLNTNIETLNERPDSILLTMNDENELVPMTALEYQNLSAEMSCISSLIQWLIAVNCANVSLDAGTPPSKFEISKIFKKKKVQIHQYYETKVSVSRNKPKTNLKYGEIYSVGGSYMWQNFQHGL